MSDEGAERNHKAERLQRQLNGLRKRILVDALMQRGVDEDYAREVLAPKHFETIEVKEDGSVDREAFDMGVRLILDSIPPKFIGDSPAAADRSGTYDPVAEGKRMAAVQKRSADSGDLARR
jgi:hypothetical protein